VDPPGTGELASVPFVTTLVFFSGCAALIFQIAWMREMRLVFGATTAAVAAVLAIFMAGLGVGSAILGGRADRDELPLRMYGALEVGIALSAAVSPWMITVARWLYIGMGGLESLGFFWATIVRLALTAIVLAVPSFLMGGTLPAAVRAVTLPADTNRRRVGLLYGANTLGAVFGAGVATLFALESLGTRATLWLGCAMGLAVGATAIASSRKMRPIVASDDANKGADRVTESPVHKGVKLLPAPPWIIYATAGVLGFAFFALELVWYRMLAPILGGTTYTFGFILCIALLGIGLGGVAYNYLAIRLRPTLAGLAITCGCEALFTILPFALGDRLALLAARLNQGAGDFVALVLGWALVLSIVVLPSAFISGIQFPLLTGLLGSGRRTVSNHLGRAYAWNTSGAILGSLVGGFGALPFFSAPGLWKLIAGLLVVHSVAVLIASGRAHWLAAGLVSALAVSTFACMFAEGPTAAWRDGGVGGGRAFFSFEDSNSIQQWLNGVRRVVVWGQDGVECGIGIGCHNGLSFIVNGKTDGNALLDAATQMGVAALGAALPKDPKTALVIGLGTGETAGWLAELRGIEKVTVVELEPAIDEMARRCRELNCDVLHHPRVRRVYDDGREYLFTTREKFDVIVSEPSNPYRAGVATLYTTEFYRAIGQRLNQGGVFLQWLQGYEVDNETVLTVLKTARSEFRHVEVWRTLSTDLQLVCSNEPLDYTAAELRERIGSGRLKELLQRAWNVDDLNGFMAHFVGSSAWVDSIAQIPFLQFNTDDRTILEFRFAKTVGRSTPFSLENLQEQLSTANSDRPEIGEELDWNAIELRRQVDNVLLNGQLSASMLPDKDDQKLIAALEFWHSGDFARAIERWPAKYREPSDSILRLLLAKAYAEMGRAESESLLPAVEARHPLDAAAIRAIYHWRRGNEEQTLVALTSFFTQLKDSPWLVPSICDDVADIAVEVSEKDGKAAKQCYELLSRPFASFCFEEQRRRGRVLIAADLGNEELVESLADVEPNVFWAADVLKPRAAAYAAVNHPLAGRAQREWGRFQSQEKGLRRE